MQTIPRLASSMAVTTMLLLAIAPAATGQDEPEMSEEATAQMQAWMALANPGEHHEHLAAYVGTWKSEIKMWMEPGTDPMINPAESEARVILGGRFLEWTHIGNFGGMPFEGRQLDGYNNGDQRYETTWADNFGTLVVNYTGQCEDDGKVRTMHGEMTDPMSGGTIPQRAVYSWQDDDHWTYESYMGQGEMEFKNMEIHYSRM